MLRSSALAQILLASALVACGGSSDSSSNGSDTGATSDGATLDTGPTPDAVSETTADGATEIGTDADAVSEAAPETAHVDAAGAVGTACTDGSQCNTDFCITDTRFPGGYCSEPIAECPAPGGTFDPCPTGSKCLNVGITGGTGSGDACMRDCTGDGDCRAAEGYKCCPISSTLTVCLPTSLCLP